MEGPVVSASAVPPEGPGGFPPGAVWVDREDEARRVLDFVVSARSRLVILYGRHGIGKTSLILRWVIPAVQAGSRYEAFYGKCSPRLPERVSGLTGEHGLWSAAERHALIFLDSFERLLDLPDGLREEILVDVCARVRSPQCAAILVLILDEDRLGRAFALRTYLPEVAHAALEIKGIDTQNSIAALHSLAHQQAFDYDAEVLEELGREIAVLGSPGEDVSPELLRVIGEQLRHLRQGAEAPLDVQEYRAMGGLENLLRGFVDRRLQDLPLAAGFGQELGRAVLEEVATAWRAGRAPELSGLPERLEADGGDLEKVLAWLQGPGGLLREGKKGGFEVVPQGLGAVLLKDAARRRLETKESQWILQEGARAWSQVGTLPARETFERVDRQRRLLELTEEEAEIGLHCALRHQSEEDLQGARYWLRRIRSEQGRSEALLLAVFDASPAVRAKAAALLGEFPRPEVRDQLYLLALKDPEPRVRAVAVRSLGGMRNAELRGLLMQEVQEASSPYHVEAVDALRTFPDEETVGFLRKLVAGRESGKMLRRKAIEVLSSLQVPAAAEALVKIALEDEDAEDRRGAAHGLGSWQDERLVRECLEKLRAARPRKDGYDGLLERLRGSLPALGRGALALLVAFANLFLHGLALLVIRRYLLGALVFAAQAAAVRLMMGSDFSLFGFGLLLFLVSLAAGQLLPASLLLRQRREGRFESGTFRGLLTVFLFAAATLSSIWWLHGLAHALVGRWRRAALLLACESVGIVLIVTMDLALARYLLPSPLREGYVWLGWALFWGSFLYDVVRVLRDSVMRRDLDERRWEVYRELLRGGVAPDIVLERLGSADREDSKWARSLLRRCGSDIKPDLLLKHLRDTGRTRRFVVSTLARDNREKLTQGLGDLWGGADGALRRTIFAILVSRPTEASVAALRRLQADLRPWQRVRAWLSPWHFRVRVWPKGFLVIVLLVAPLVIGAAYEGWDHGRRPYKPQLRVVEDPDALARFRVYAAEYLARAHPADTFDALAAVFLDTDDAEVRLGIAHSLGLIALSDDEPTHLRSRALEELAQGLERWGGDRRMREAIVAELKTAGPKVKAFFPSAETGRLERMLQISNDFALRRAALDVLEAVRGVGVLQAFVQRAGTAMDSGKGARTGAEELVRRRQDEALQSEAVVALGRIGSRESIEALRALQRSRIPEVLAARVQEELSNPLRPLEALYKEGRYQPVVIEAEQLDEVVPEGQRLNLLGKAECALSLAAGEPEAPLMRSQCIEHLEQARAADSADSEALSLLARSYVAEAEARRAAGRLDEALAAAGSAIQVLPSFTAAHALQGAIYGELGRRDEAIGALDEAIRREPEASSTFLTIKGQLLLETEQYEPAREALLAAIDRNPDDGWSLHLLRQSYVRQGRPREAERALVELRNRHPESQEIRLVLAYLYHEDLSGSDPEAYGKALAEVKKAVAAPRGAGPLVLANLAESQVTTRRYADAAETARELLERLSGDPGTELNVRFLRYAALLLAEDLDAAREALQELEQSFGHLPEGFENTWIYDGTFRFFERSELPPERKDALLELGNLIKAGKASDAGSAEVFAANRAALEP